MRQLAAEKALRHRRLCRRSSTRRPRVRCWPQTRFFRSRTGRSGDCRRLLLPAAARAATPRSSPLLTRPGSRWCFPVRRQEPCLRAGFPRASPSAGDAGPSALTSTAVAHRRRAVSFCRASFSAFETASVSAGRLPRSPTSSASTKPSVRGVLHFQPRRGNRHDQIGEIRSVMASVSVMRHDRSRRPACLSQPPVRHRPGHRLA